MLGRTAALVMAAALLAAIPATASAHARFVGAGVVALPLWPPAYPYAYWVDPPVPPPWAVYDATLPDAWQPGRWEWERDSEGRRYPVYVPAHLR